MFKLSNVLLDEFSEGSDGSSGNVGLGGAGESDSSGDSAPLFLRDISEEDAYVRLKHLPDQLSAIESRFGETVSPLQQRLEQMQQSLGNQTAFEPKFEKLAKVLEEYDPSLAKVLLPALEESLRESINFRPLDQTSLEPHVSPMLQKMQSQSDQQMALGLLEAYDIDVNSIIPPVEGEQWKPQTQAHKDFIQWYSMQDGKTQWDLSQPGLAFARAMYKFKKWNGGLNKEREKAAENSSARLNAGQQPSAAGRRGTTPRLETEADGFLSVFKS